MAADNTRSCSRCGKNIPRIKKLRKSGPPGVDITGAVCDKCYGELSAWSKELSTKANGMLLT